MIRIICRETDGTPVAFLEAPAIVSLKSFDVVAADLIAWLGEHKGDGSYIQRSVVGVEVLTGEAKELTR